MKTAPVSPFTCIEALESRIAPAGLVTAVYVAGTGELTVTSVAAVNHVSIFETGANTYRVEGIGTNINTVGTFFLDIGKLNKLTIVGGTGDEEFTLTNLRSLTALSYSGGGGEDTLDAENLTVKGAVQIHGNAGSDTVRFTGVSTTISGNVTIDSAAGASDLINVFFEAQKTAIGGSVLFTGGGSSDTLSAFGLGTVTIGKGVKFDAGAGGGNLSLSSDALLTIGKLGTGESVFFTGGDGGDTMQFGGVNLKLAGGIRMTGAADIDGINLGNSETARIGKLSSGQSILFDGGDNLDFIDSSATSIVMKGGIDFVGGDGPNSISLQGASHSIKIGKLATGESIRFTGGADDNSIQTESASLVLAGGIDLAAGGGSNSIDVKGLNGKASIGKLASGQSIRLIGLGGSDAITSEVASLSLAGGIELGGGDGSNRIEIDSDNGTTNIGKLAGGRSILFNGGTGTDQITIAVPHLTLSGGIEFNAAGDFNGLDIDEGGSVKIGKFGAGQSILFTGTTDATNEVDLGGLVTLAGSLEMTGGSGDDDVDFDGKVSVGKSSAGVSVQMSGGAGEDEIDFNGIITLAGSLKLDGGIGDDKMDLNGPDVLIVKGPVEFLGGADEDSFDLDAGTVAFGSTVTFTGGDDADTATFIADGSIAGNVSTDLGLAAAGSQDFIFKSRTGLPSALALKGSLTVDASAVSTADSFTLTNVSVAKAIDIQLGDGVSTVNIDNLKAGDTFTLDTRGGADVVNFERGNFFGSSVIKKLATIQLGAGDDQLAIGSPTPTVIAPFPDSTRVNFQGGLTTDGGAGANDNRNLFENENTFGVAITPPIGFELTTLP